jgi:ElaB/YqjD/DUF883 family membrane-anchored ribosome-binding protein
VDQIRIEIDIKDAKTDPLTLQQIRDEPSIRSCFIDRAKNINALILTADGELGKTTDQKQRERILSEMNHKLGSQVDAIEKEVQSRANAFITKQKQEGKDVFWATVKMVVKVYYSVGKFAVGVVGTVTKVGAALTTGAGMFITASAIKGVIDTLNDLVKLYSEMADAVDGEEEVRKKLKAAVAEVRKLKAPKRFHKASWTQCLI